MKKTAIILGLSLFFLNACLSGVLKIKDPHLIKIKSIEVLDSNDSLLNLTINSLIENPNKIGANIKHAKIQIYMEGKYMGYADNDTNIKVKANDTSTVSMTIHLFMDSISKEFPKILAQDSVDLQMKGVYTISFIDIGLFEIKNEIKQRVALKSEFLGHINQTFNQDVIKLKKVKPQSIGLSDTKLEMELEFNNKLNLEFTVSKTSLQLFFPEQKTYFGVWDLNAPTLVLPKERKTIKALLTIDNQETLKQLLPLILGKKEILGKGSATITLSSYTFEVPINQVIKLEGLF